MKKVKINDLGEFRFLGFPRFNPSGDKLVFSVARADLEENKYLSDLYLLEVESGEIKRLTTSETERDFKWLDGHQLLFTSRLSEKDKGRAKEEDFTVIQRLDILGGEAEKWLEIPLKLEDYFLLDDDRLLVWYKYNLHDQMFFALSEADRKKEISRRKEAHDYEVIEEIPFWSNGGGFVSKNRDALAFYDVREKKVIDLYKEDRVILSVKLNPSKTMAAVISYENNGVMPLENDLTILDLATGKNKKIEFGNAEYQAIDFMSENRLFFAYSRHDLYGLNQNPQFASLDLRALQISEYPYTMESSLGNTVGSDVTYFKGTNFKVEGDKLYFVETVDTDSFLQCMDIHGEAVTMSESAGSVLAFDVKGDRLALVRQHKQSLPELFLFDEAWRKVSTFNLAYEQGHAIQVPERVVLSSRNIHGFVLTPRTVKPGKRYPGILMIHGGPKTVYGSVFMHDAQVLASEGYFVFYCNPTGSDGRGNDFADIRGKYGTVDYEDLMCFTDYVLAHYPVDPDRLCVTGGSYGGFMTNWVVGHTNRFKCAITDRSISNWVSKFGITDIGYFFNKDQIGSDPWSDVEKLWAASPLKYAPQMKTPMLLIHSDEDYRCWVPEAFQLFTALKLHGVEARLCLFHGENHELSRSGKPKHRIRRLEEMLTWLNKHLPEVL